MKNSSTILHVIDSLSIGGAEILLKNSVNILQEFCHVVVFLHEPSQIKSEFKGNVEFVCLNHKGWMQLSGTVLKLRSIIKQKKPALVHSHLFVSSLCARLATPRNLPLFNSLHSIYSIDAFKKNRKSLWIERLTLRKRHTLIGVSECVLNDYLEFIPFKGKTFVLYNFLPDTFFDVQIIPFSDSLKCLSVGNLKEAKNYPYLLQVFSNLKDNSISLDIYGDGYLKGELHKLIVKNKLSVRLMGKIEGANNLYKNYNLFVQASSHEGFGLSVIEAMAAKLPILVSDIPVFKEITSGHAYYFSLENPEKASETFLYLIKNLSELRKFTEPAFEYCKQHYSSQCFKQNLLSIYQTTLKKNGLDGLS
jgi:glycosyltransferase involved in cell wall biosynthesis